ncbi:hypothetical protein [Culicoidibacter larvae]|uniref:Uncharacterized protein n=1 Tax=Culicoidibacter larvae TaxID=2579976 RepID=A0A5R8QFE3_9FIRM|nr:hypothetical protein [Culicoidibacter larvae]TLG76692.1 hypothetical protein FEZ08_03500 [Culicoidibacter larvae]
MIKEYTICKYDPQSRNEHGTYIKDEWTSVSDIGKLFDDGICTAKNYLDVENNLVAFCLGLVKKYDVHALWSFDFKFFSYADISLPFAFEINQLIKHFSDGDEIKGNNIELIIRAMLRSNSGGTLFSRNKHLVIEMGWDYYMHLECSEFDRVDKVTLKQLNLFWKEEGRDTKGVWR